MDDNTTKVIMAIIALVSAVVTPLVLVYVTRKQNEKIDANQVQITGKVDVVEKKLDDNHRLTNGHMTTLLQTTKDLATANEKVRAASEGPPAPVTPPVEFTGATKLKIVEGEIKVTPETTKKKK